MESLLIVFFLLLGVFFIFVAGVGIVRLPDTLCRAHALSKALTLGIMLMLFALMITLNNSISTVKLLLATLFQFITIPVSGHVFALYAITEQKKEASGK